MVTVSWRPSSAVFAEPLASLRASTPALDRAGEAVAFEHGPADAHMRRVRPLGARDGAALEAVEECDVVGAHGGESWRKGIHGERARRGAPNIRRVVNQ